MEEDATRELMDSRSIARFKADFECVLLRSFVANDDTAGNFLTTDDEVLIEFGAKA